MVQEYTTQSAEDTVALGHELSAKMRDLRLVLLRGDLGAGKTTLIKGIAEGFSAAERDVSCSSTTGAANPTVSGRAWQYSWGRNVDTDDVSVRPKPLPRRAFGNDSSSLAMTSGGVGAPP